MTWYYLKCGSKYIGAALCDSIHSAILTFFNREKVKSYYIEPFTKNPHYYVVVLHAQKRKKE